MRLDQVPRPCHRRSPLIRCLLCPDTGVAYVVKPDTFSRFFAIPLHVGHSALTGENQATPTYSSILGTSAQNLPRLAAIDADFTDLGCTSRH